jgi:hypothetical protein
MTKAALSPEVLSGKHCESVAQKTHCPANRHQACDQAMTINAAIPSEEVLEREATV